MWGGVPFAYLLLSRLAYVVGVGVALKQEERHQSFTRRYGVAGGYARFVRWSMLLMINDNGAFIVLCLVSMNTLRLPVLRGVVAGAGLVIAVVGLLVKTWATRSLGPRSYFWYNFFDPSEPLRSDLPGPYRFLKNPMYGVGYLQTYGLALLTGSLPGLAGSAFMHATIMIFNDVVEKPHFESLVRDAARRRANAPSPELDSAAARSG